MGNNLASLALMGLATYRATKLLLDDEILREPREKLLEKVTPGSKIDYFLNCPWCISIWTAGALVVIDKVSPLTGDTIKKVLASSAITGIIETRL